MCEGATVNHENGVVGRLWFEYKGQVVWSFPDKKDLGGEAYNWWCREIRQGIISCMKGYSQLSAKEAWELDIFDAPDDSIKINLHTSVYERTGGFRGIFGILKVLDSASENVDLKNFKWI
jgi:hypothetical protein